MRPDRLFPALTVVATVAALSGCDRTPSPEGATVAPPPPQNGRTGESRSVWASAVSGSGMAVVLSDTAGAPMLRIACVRDPAVMTVVVEPFEPVASEERLSLGVDDEPFVFVADPTADRPSGVEAEAPIPGALLDRLAAAREVRVVYGAQTLGPHPPPDPEMAERFVGACRQIAAR